MKLKLWVAFGTLLAAALGVQAQQNSRTPDGAEPSVAVPAIAYNSALSGYTAAMKVGEPSPDKSWRAANDVVGGQSTHSGHESPAPAAGEEPRRTEPAAPPTAHHKHHQGETKQ